MRRKLLEFGRKVIRPHERSYDEAKTNFGAVKMPVGLQENGERSYFPMVLRRRCTYQNS